jgi:hypothetical protein
VGDGGVVPRDFKAGALLVDRGYYVGDGAPIFSRRSYKQR